MSDYQLNGLGPQMTPAKGAEASEKPDEVKSLGHKTTDETKLSGYSDISRIFGSRSSQVNLDPGTSDYGSLEGINATVMDGSSKESKEVEKLFNEAQVSLVGEKKGASPYGEVIDLPASDRFGYGVVIDLPQSSQNSSNAESRAMLDYSDEAPPLKILTGKFEVVSREQWEAPIRGSEENRQKEDAPLLSKQTTQKTHSIVSRFFKAFRSKDQDVLSHVSQRGKGYIDEARKLGKTLEKKVKIEGKVEKLIINPNGKIYVVVGAKNQEFLAEGAYKSVGKMVKVASYSFKEAPLKTKEKARVVMKSSSASEEVQYEKNLNRALLRHQKMDKESLSKVVLTKDLGALLTSDFATEGDLEGYLAKHKGADLADLCTQMAEGVDQLHHFGIIHRDLKPDNFLVFKDSKGNLDVKVTDLGKATDTHLNGPKNQTKEFFLDLTPPDLDFSSEAIDVYQLGASFTLMWMNLSVNSPDHPFKLPLDNDKKNVDMRRREYGVESIMDYKWDEKWKTIPEPVREILTKMLDPDPVERPSMSEVKGAFLQYQKTLST